jgi:hypothetical protein
MVYFFFFLLAQQFPESKELDCSCNNWTFANNPVVSTLDSYVAAQFCPTNPRVQSSAVPNGSENMLFDSSFKCIGSTNGEADDQLSVRAYPALSTQFTFSGDDATMLVEQFMDQVMNRTATESNWEYLK